MSGSQLSELEKSVMKKSVPMSEALETANLLKRYARDIESRRINQLFCSVLGEQYEDSSTETGKAHGTRMQHITMLRPQQWNA